MYNAQLSHTEKKFFLKLMKKHDTVENIIDMILHWKGNGNKNKPTTLKTLNAKRQAVVDATNTLKEKYKLLHLPNVDKCQSPLEVEFLKRFIEVCPDYSIKPQVHYGKYIADFVINKALVVEIDGKDWHTEEGDEKKNVYYRTNNIRFIRFPGTDIYNNLDGCIDAIVTKIKGNKQIIFNTRLLLKQYILGTRNSKIYNEECGLANRILVKINKYFDMLDKENIEDSQKIYDKTDNIIKARKITTLESKEEKVVKIEDQ